MTIQEVPPVFGLLRAALAQHPGDQVVTVRVGEVNYHVTVAEMGALMDRSVVKDDSTPTWFAVVFMAAFLGVVIFILAACWEAMFG